MRYQPVMDHKFIVPYPVKENKMKKIIPPFKPRCKFFAFLVPRHDDIDWDDEMLEGLPTVYYEGVIGPIHGEVRGDTFKAVREYLETMYSGLLQNFEIAGITLELKDGDKSKNYPAKKGSINAALDEMEASDEMEALAEMDDDD